MFLCRRSLKNSQKRRKTISIPHWYRYGLSKNEQSKFETPPTPKGGGKGWCPFTKRVLLVTPSFTVFNYHPLKPRQLEELHMYGGKICWVYIDIDYISIHTAEKGSERKVTRNEVLSSVEIDLTSQILVSIILVIRTCSNVEWLPGSGSILIFLSTGISWKTLYM